jgi:hypothetical protein
MIEMSVVYVFKVTSKHRKSIWRKIEILESQTLGQFDRMIRDAFNYEQHDHLSEFYRGKVWSSSGFGEIEPGGRGKGSSRKINELKIKPGDKLEYVYDFGDSIMNVIELIEIIEEDPGSTYPRVTAKNKQRNIYCERCQTKGKKEVAKYNVYYFDDDSVEQLCESCTDSVSEDVDISEIVY